VTAVFCLPRGILAHRQGLKAKNAASLGGFNNACNLTNTLPFGVFVVRHTFRKSVEENKLSQEKELAFNQDRKFILINSLNNF
jgi:hypothetical protein